MLLQQSNLNIHVCQSVSLLCGLCTAHACHRMCESRVPVQAEPLRLWLSCVLARALDD